MAEEPINLESVKDGPFIPEFHQKPYELWNDLLQPGSQISPAEAAKRINELFPLRKPEDDDESYAEAAELFLWHFWELLIKIVQLLPYEHQAQTKVILIIEELSRLPPIMFRRFYMVCSSVYV